MDNINNSQKTRVLVLAPMFPTVNQPWMDTYLEQLLLQGLVPLIYTENKSVGIYHEKVDRLKLRDYIVDFNLEDTLSLKTFLKASILCPFDFVKTAYRALLITRELIGKYSLAILPTYLKLLRFGVASSEFEHVNNVHSHSESLAFEFMFFSLMRGKPLLYTFHGPLPKGVEPISYDKRKMLYGEVDGVLVNTQFSKQQLSKLGCPVEKIMILPQGLPLDDFPFVQRRAPMKGEILSLLTVGRFHHDKGQQYAILALRRLISSGVDVHWAFVGTGPDKDEFVSLVGHLKLTEHVTFYEDLKLEEIRSFYRQCHLFILPSLSNRHNNKGGETQGVVLQEAQASGCIPIATRVGGIPDCLNHKVDSILVKDRSSRSIFNAIRYLLNRPEEWRRYQKNGRQNVEQNFIASIIGQRMSVILNKLKT